MSARDLVVVGQGAAGLAAALAAAEEARARSPVRVTLIDKAPEDEAGGNTRWSPSYMRMAAPDRVEPSFVRDMLAATGPKATKPISRASPPTRPRPSRGSRRTASRSRNRPTTWRKVPRASSRPAAGRRSSRR